jgi:hypothetical protein
VSELRPGPRHALVVLALIVTWPDPPWRSLLGGGAVLMVLTPVAFYPRSRPVWLAIDLLFRPTRPEDFAPDRPDDSPAARPR